MRAGGLRQRLVIEEDVGGNTHAMGGRTHDWQEYLKVRSRAAYKSGKEFERAQQRTAELTTLFVIRYDSRLDTKEMHHMRIRSLDDSSIYRIHFAADPDHKRRQIHIHTSENQYINED